ncbi:hypothetical protein SYJ56_04640 [Algoriphagus sp. D3-2-R+10]|uniref:hypothetical protein n=1 Tax=Algoriphagus aurantiacus TaxID=3103948 RepID=UPI002B3815D4|nr:hypothetical protein [Algoriphagus sp. D3-2-R+10]MEB2774580.1 hypothetical protein [Algoriphagus sp. D3-2-R+10]
MKALLTFLILISISSYCFGQTPIHDKAIVAQQERMVFKQWDEDKFYPKPKRFLGIPTNPLWYSTWALHPNYPDLDRRPLSTAGEQTQRLGLAAAMQISSDYYKAHSDTIKNLANAEIARISGALSATDPLYQLYYKKELKPLEDAASNAFQGISSEVVSYMTDHGAYQWYLNNMTSLSERYGFAKSLDMERGQRILMYHRIMLEMRDVLKKWDYKLAMSANMLAFRTLNQRRINGEITLSDPKDEEERAKRIANQTQILQ